MARDRKRSRQRRQSPVTGAGGAPNRLHHANVSGELEHASGEVEEFDAAIVRGAHGAAHPASEPDPDEAEPELDRQIDESEVDEEELNRAADQAFGGDGDDKGGGLRPVSRGRGEQPARRESGNRVLAFLRASWAELQRVQWPDRRQVAQATTVVLGFVVIAGVYLGVADYVAKKIVDAIL